jgi:adenylosuccinate lyase
MSLLKGLTSIEPNKEKIKKDLNENWNILSEAMQVEARGRGNDEAYEEIAQRTKQQYMGANDWKRMTKGSSKSIQLLTPDTYIGESVRLAHLARKEIQSILRAKT